MSQHPNLRRASRLYEMMIHDGVPETPQPMYEESTYGRTPSRLTGKASNVSNPISAEVDTAALYFVRSGQVVSEVPQTNEGLSERVIPKRRIPSK